MDHPSKANSDPGPALATLLWLAGCGFMLAATSSFVAYERLHLPWWPLAVVMGVLIGVIVLLLEGAIARPLDRLARTLSLQPRDGELQLPINHTGAVGPAEVQRIWRALRMLQDGQSSARLAGQANESRLSLAQRQMRVLAAAGRALRPDVMLEQVAPSMLRDLASILGVPAVYLVPLRRQSRVPVLSAAGTPDWAEAVRAGGLSPWYELLAQNLPVAIGLTAAAPAWTSVWARRTLWIVPLTYHGRVLGLLLAIPTGAERAFTREELQLFESLSPILAASLYPPRWSEERKQRVEERRREIAAAYPAGVEAADGDADFEDELEDDEHPHPAQRRQRQGT